MRSEMNEIHLFLIFQILLDSLSFTVSGIQWSVLVHLFKT